MHQNAGNQCINAVPGATCQAPIVVFSYYFLGLPCAWLLAWPCHLATLGLSLGALLGTSANFLGFAALLRNTDWRRHATVKNGQGNLLES